MSLVDSFGELVGSIIATILMLILAVVSFFITVFIVDVGAGLAGAAPDDGFLVLAAAVLAGAAIVAGATPLTAHMPAQE
jgi:hypothetical protein